MPGHPLAPYAREAYAAGFARSGGPMTPRVKAGCAAAVALACEHADNPHILEATLKLGSLEGLWAAIYQRRDDLAVKHARATTTVWRKAVTHDAITAAVRDYRRRTGLLAEDATDEQQRRDQLAADAIAAANLMLAALPYGTAWASLRLALRDAIAAGRAEGVVGAIALAAEQAGAIGIDWDLAFTHAYAELARLDELWADADGWLAKMLDRAATDLGRALAQSAERGDSYEDMLTAAVDALGSEDVDAVGFIVDWALNTGLARGALDLYASEGVTDVDWLTAGDARVCPTCDANEANSPYPPRDFPDCPDHPRCRCTPAGNWVLPAAYDTYLLSAA